MKRVILALDESKRFIEKHCFEDAFAGVGADDMVCKCKFCLKSAWLPQDIKHKPKCSVGKLLKQIKSARDEAGLYV
jgi:hypothetical protein